MLKRVADCPRRGAWRRRTCCWCPPAAAPLPPPLRTHTHTSPSTHNSAHSRAAPRRHHAPSTTCTRPSDAPTASLRPSPAHASRLTAVCESLSLSAHHATRRRQRRHTSPTPLATAQRQRRQQHALRNCSRSTGTSVPVSPLRSQKSSAPVPARRPHVATQPTCRRRRHHQHSLSPDTNSAGWIGDHFTSST